MLHLTLSSFLRLASLSFKVPLLPKGRGRPRGPGRPKGTTRLNNGLQTATAVGGSETAEGAGEITRNEAAAGEAAEQSGGTRDEEDGEGGGEAGEVARPR